jgi:DNA-binding NarL/FixJ family response regulator
MTGPAPDPAGRDDRLGWGTADDDLRRWHTEATPVLGRGIPAGVIRPREWEVLRAMATGRTAADVGHELHISEQTVKNHLQHVYKVLDVDSLVGAYSVLGWLRADR